MRSLCVTSSKRMLQGCFAECAVHELNCEGDCCWTDEGADSDHKRLLAAHPEVRSRLPLPLPPLLVGLPCVAPSPSSFPRSLPLPCSLSDCWLRVRRCDCEWSGSLEGRRAAVIAIAVRVAASPFIGPFGLRAMTKAAAIAAHWDSQQKAKGRWEWEQVR